ncbi:hypothetical protein CRG98_039179 [Punica granatum]|uniref:Uncharacterized protein n=1 Tax=Punica granatum TaxID=22663 RepID=A0A2I0I8X4_PUNGR|nr:hypothetical protein CRG98_039179 [Punica granatum]
MRSHFRRPQCEASKAPVGHVRSYRDILNDALAALSIIRRARRLRTLLVRKCKVEPWEVPSSNARPMGCRAWGTLNLGSPVIVTLEQLDSDWEPYSCTFPDCGLVCAAVPVKTRRAESHWDMRVGQCDRSPVAGGLGHAMFVGAAACDLSWGEGQSSVFGVRGGSREVFPISIVVVWDLGCLLVGYFLQWEKGNDKGANYVRNFSVKAQGIELA